MDGVDAVKDKIDVSKESNKNSAEHEAKSLVETVKEKAAGAYNYVAGGEGDKGLVGTVKEKATEAYNYVAEKVSEATHAVTGEANKDVAKDSNHSAGTRASAPVDAAKE